MRILVFDRRGGSKFVTCDTEDTVNDVKRRTGAGPEEDLKFGDKAQCLRVRFVLYGIMHELRINMRILILRSWRQGAQYCRHSW